MHAAVASRLRREELEESGKFRRELAEQARERDFTRSAVVAVGREGKKGRTDRIHQSRLSDLVS